MSLTSGGNGTVGVGPPEAQDVLIGSMGRTCRSKTTRPLGRSSVVEQRSVKPLVVGPNPTDPANKGLNDGHRKIGSAE